MVVTEVDQVDRRRTLARTKPQHVRRVPCKGRASVVTALADAFDESDPAKAAVLFSALRKQAPLPAQPPPPELIHILSVARPPGRGAAPARRVQNSPSNTLISLSDVEEDARDGRLLRAARRERALRRT